MTSRRLRYDGWTDPDRQSDARRGRGLAALPPDRDGGTTPFARTCECGRSRALRTALLASALMSAAVSARAQDATWLANPGSGDFNTAANWSTGTVPTGTASFGTSNATSLSSSAPTVIGGWTFNAGASSYSFTNDRFLQFDGAGIVVNGGSAAIANSSVLLFRGASTAGNAAITNNDRLAFNANSTAGSATINNNGAGVLYFFDTSTAGSATINNNGAVLFTETSTAGSATINNNGSVRFHHTSTGGTARLINGAAGTIDLSFLANAGMTAGSIEGAGTIGLGAKNLAVGGNNLSTTFSGVLQDGGGGGSLTKTGTGTLTLSGTSTYTGATTVDAGTLRAGAANTFAPFSAFTVAAGATLDLDGFNQTIGSLAGAGNVSLGSATLTTGNDNTSTTFAGAIGGAGGLTKIGTGTLTLSGTNTYAGATTVDAGTLQAGAANAFAPFSAFTVAAGTTLDLNGFNQAIGSLAGAGAVSLGSATLTTGNDGTSTTFAGAIGGAGGLTKIGIGTLTLSGTNTYTGATTVDAGTFRVNGSIASSVITNNATLQFLGTGTAGNATINNNLFLQFLGTSTAGNATINNNLFLQFFETSTAGSATITNNDTLIFDGTSTAGSATITNHDNLAFRETSTAGSAAITNNANLQFLGTSTAGSATITNNNRLLFVNTSTGGTARLINGAAGTIDLSFLANAGMTAGSIEGAGTIRLGAKNLAVGGNNLSTTFSGVLQDGGFGGGTGGSLTKTGTGTLTLSGSNTYTGATTVDAGTLRAGAANAFAPFSAFTVTAGATLDLNGFNQTIGSLAGAGNVSLGSATLTTGNDGTSTTFAGAIGGAGGLTKIGTGTLTLSGTNTYAGATTVDAGTLRVNGSIASSTIANNAILEFRGTSSAGSATITNNNVLQFVGTSTAGSATIANNNTLFFVNTSTAGSATITNNNLLQFVDTSTGDTARLINGAAGTIDLSFLANAGMTAGSIEGAGTIRLGAKNLAVGGNNLSTTFSGVLQDGGFAGGTGGSLTKTGTGTLTLSGSNTYTGATTVDAGTLRAGAANAFAPVSAFTVAAGGTLDLDGFNQTIGSLAGAGAVSLGSATLTTGNDGTSTTFAGAIGGPGGLTKIGTGTLTLSGTNTYTGATTVDAGTLQAGAANAFAPFSAFTVAAGATLDLNGFDQTIGSLAGAGNVGLGLGLGSATLTTGNDGTSTIFAGAIAGTGGLAKIGTGTLTLAGSSSYLGATAVDAGTLRAGAANAFAPSSAFTVATGAMLDLDGFNQTIGSLAGAGNVGLGSATLTTGNDGTSTIFAGAIAGTGGVTKTGAGRFTLSGINLYSGNTNVNGGALIVDGSIASSVQTTVNAGGTLSGNGTVGNTTINDGGTLSPGSSIGTLTIQGNLVMASAAAYLVEVTPANADRVDVTGTATLGGTVQAVFAPGSYVTRSYTILTSADLGGTQFAGVTSNVPGFGVSLSYVNDQDVILNLTATLGQGGGLNQNQQNVATAINTFFNNGGALPPNFVNVFGLTGGNLASTLSLLSGEAATGAQQGAFQLGGQFLGLMLDPFVDGRGGMGGGMGGGGAAIGFAPEREALPDSIALAYSKVTKAPPYNKAAPAAFEQRWTAWGGAFGGYNRTGGDPAVIGSHDLTARTAGVAAGLDYHFSRDAVFGFALAGGGTNWSVADGLGGGKSDAFQAGVYAAARSGPAYLAASLAFAHHWMSTDRNAAFGNHLTAGFNAQSIGARVESGYRVGTPASAITPYAALQAQSFHTPTYSETDVDGGGFGLTYNTRTAHDIRGELGARFDHVALVDPTAVLTLRSRLAWAHDWVSDPSLAAVFQALPGASFIVNGAAPAKDSALASAGAELKLANGVTLSAKLDGEFASRAQTYTGTGTVRWAW